MLIRPLPKLPTRSLPLASPKPAGARASPHGEFKGRWVINRLTKLPLVSNTLTKPWPGPWTSSCLSGVLFGIGDIDRTVDTLDAERAIPRWNAGIDKGGAGIDLVEAGVVHFDLGVVEVGRIKAIQTVIDSESFIDGSLRAVVDREDGVVTSTLGFQPEMPPSSLTKMKRAGPDFVPLLTTKFVPELKTWPVGAENPSVLLAEGGIVTTRGNGLPSRS